jgi:hypothetical protein
MSHSRATVAAIPGVLRAASRSVVSEASMSRHLKGYVVASREACRRASISRSLVTWARALARFCFSVAGRRRDCSFSSVALGVPAVP